jgi:uncharacterized protein involved in exopolysaccharide biosynthesis
MSKTSIQPDGLNLLSILKLIAKWRKQLIYTGISAIVAGIIITMPQIMTPMFKATSVIYPVNLQSYSKETPTEQMVQLLNSEDVRENLIKDFDLFMHYDIDSTGSYPRFEIMKRLEENISVAKTEYESIEISIVDKDPETAARMCDSLSSYVDRKAISLIRERAMEVLNIVGMQMAEKKHELDSLEARIQFVRTNYGITDFENQIEGFSREYYRTMGSGSANSKMATQQKNFEEKGGEYITLKEFLWRARGSYLDYKLKYEQTLTDTKKELDFHNTITRASVPERKDSPKRTLIILIFTFTVMFFAVLYIIYLEHYKKVVDKEVAA